MELLPGEAKLSEASDGSVLLTSHRLRLDQGPGRAKQFVSVTLDSVASCSLGTHSYPFLLLLALLLVTGGFQLGGERLATVSFGIGAFMALGCVVLYFLTREQVITVRSAGDPIRIRTRGVARAACIQFIDDLEGAKLRL
jgi:hypothetical protein